MLSAYKNIKKFVHITLNKKITFNEAFEIIDYLFNWNNEIIRL